MKKTKKIIAMAATLAMLGTMNVVVAPSLVSADEAVINVTETTQDTAMPDWVPQDYAQALKFYNKYGKTHIENELICTVKPMSSMTWSSSSYVTENAGSTFDYSDDIIFQETFDEFIWPQEPVASDYETNEEFLNACCEYDLWLDELYLSSDDKEYFEGVEYYFEVTVYRTNEPGTINLSWLNIDTTRDKLIDQIDLSFEVDENGTVTETDYFGWVPDSVSEYKAFIKQHGKAAVYNNHIIYCDDVLYNLIVDQSGSGIAESVFEGNVNEIMIMTPDGSPSNHVRVYKPISAGNITMTWINGPAWDLDADYVDKTVQYYTIDENLNITAEDNCGDCNLDGTPFKISDAVAMKKWLTGANDDIFCQNADVNKDGKINAFDFVIMKRRLMYLTGLPEVENHLDYTVLEDEWVYNSYTEMTFRAFIANSADEFYNVIESNEALTHEAIDESVFEDKAAVVVYVQSGAGNRVITVDDVFIKSHEKLVIDTTTAHPDFATPDMPYKRIVLLVDKNAVAEVTETVVSNTNVSES